ncbi:hypothetical protein BX661DRAFT_69666 [Kickxella alabastrina]|uniref:uncharacterized protein n=1 Tax=Kickxella alabastrina TaxID=61397 RepID=UPI00221EC5F8|nr:uncharacterized protein BX661DRAFT_69666 [Kickxella alabastrina]KAI7820727.1 hypothetical protein BX661DRAFT_69666 [Kickxella alabastrina]
MVFNAIRKATFDQPFAVWGLALGFTGPLLMLTVPPLRQKLGYQAPTLSLRTILCRTVLDAPPRALRTKWMVRENSAVWFFW